MARSAMRSSSRQHLTRLAHGLQGLGQEGVVEGLAWEIGQIVIGVALHHRQPARQAQGHVGRTDLKPASLDLTLAAQQVQQQTLAAADIQHARARPHHADDGAEILAAGGVRRAHGAMPRV